MFYRFLSFLFCLTVALLVPQSGSAQENVRSASGLVLPQAQPPVFTGNIYAVIVGVSHYQNTTLNTLAYADDDACLFKQYLQSKAGGNVPDSTIYFLLNERGTRADLWSTLRKVGNRVKKGDLVYIYFAGHGSTVDTEYFLLHSGFIGPDEPGTFNGLDASELNEFRNYFTKKTVGVNVILVVDACRSFEIPGAQDASEPKNPIFETEGIGYLTLLSASNGQKSLESMEYGGGHGLYTYYLVNGMAGAADSDKNQIVTVGELNRYVKEKVYTVSKEQQDPTYCCPNRDRVPISRVDTTFRFQRSACGLPQDLPGKRGRSWRAEQDTSGNYWLQQLKKAIAEFRFKGEMGVGPILDSLMLCCAGSTLLDEANELLGISYLNFGQELITFYIMGSDSKAFTRSLLNPDEERKAIRQQFSQRETELSDKIKKYGKKKRKKIKQRVVVWKEEQQRLALLLHLSDSLEEQSNNRLERLQEANFKEAADWMRKALRWMDPDSFLYPIYEPRIRFLELYAAQSGLGDTLLLRSLLDTLMTTDSSAYMLNLAGKTWTRLGAYDQAVEALQQAVRKAKKWAYPYNNLGELFDLQHEYKQAEEWYRKAISIDSMFVYADNNLAMNLEMQQRFDDAKAVYEAALMKDGGYAMTYNNLGQLYLKQGNLDEAILYFKKAVEVQPEHPFSTENLFNQYLLREEAEEVARLGLEARRLRSDTSLLDRVLPAGGGQDPASELVEVVPGKRLALVIGNMRYPKGVSRRYHEMDADEMESVLKKTGFVIKKVKNATKKEFKKALQEFSSDLASGTYEAALFYYAGHSVALEGRNYLQPVDAAPGSAAEVAATCLDLQEVMLHLSIAPETAKLLLLDVGYENPFLKNWHPKAEKGGVLNSISAPYRSMLVFSQEHGDVPVFDIVNDVYKTSVFSRGMASFWEKPKCSMDTVVRRAREQISKEASSLGQSQRPWVAFNGLEGFSLTAPATEALLAYRPCKGFLDTILGRMVLVKGGTFTMGCATETVACERDELPTHRVTLSDYYLSETEVTQAQWWAVMGTRPSAGKPCEECPVENVSWEDIQKFLERLNQSGTGVHYRLPTEAEWEFAARGGLLSEGSVFSGSATLEEVGWYDSNTKKGPQPVKQKRPNELGIYDLSGNIQEWCADRFGTYSARGQRNPVGPLKGNYRVHRGGSWNEDEEAARLSYRLFNAPTSQQASLGFRVAASMQRGRRTY